MNEPGEASSWEVDLFPYQVEGVNRLHASNAVLLADDMGLGKTIQALAALRRLFAEGQLTRAMVVVPASIIPQWRQQMYRWAPELRFSTVRGPARERSWKWRTPAEIYLVSYETLRSDFSTNPHSPVGRAWDVVILDEAQRIKNRSGESAHVCKALKRKRAWALTGTPLENRLDDLASILEFTAPRLSELDQSHISAFDDIVARQSEVQLRRRKQDVLKDLPPKMRNPITIELTPAQRRSYEKAEQQGIVELRQLGSRLTITHVLELITRLKQICNFCPETGDSAKLEDLSERLSVIQAENEKALVFSQFVQNPFGIAQIRSRLGLLNPLAFTGEMSVEQREVVIQRFRNDPGCSVLLLSLRAGGLGLNLPEASHVIHFDRWWNPATEQQAEDRAHRIGQRSTVFVHSYICENTIEERIDEILREKRNLFNAVIDGQTGVFSANEIFGLVGLENPGR